LLPKCIPSDKALLPDREHPKLMRSSAADAHR
jgi:hypothetical protein